jgi:hypothetical protein
MIEFLALPDWNTPPRSIADWVAGFAAVGRTAVVARDEDNDVWIEVAPLRLRGLMDLEGDAVASVHFELHQSEAEPASRVVEEVARGLGWEVYPDEDDIEDSSEI